ncbi:MAG: hypothetical protein LJF04_16140 [Gemmatimonadetes bacterium]|nr:hypothetical protein [Gemmatimonadota bacterium]
MVTYGRLLLRGLPVLTLSLLVPACGVEGPLEGTRDGDLSQEEAYHLAASMGLESLAWGVQKSRATGGGGAVPAPSRTETVTVSYSVTRVCVLGGTVDSSGLITVQSDVDPVRNIADITATDVHHGCVFLVGEQHIAVTGDPDVTTIVHAASMAGQSWGTQTVSVVGAVTWEAEDGRSGRCVLDVHVEADDLTQRTWGQACGYAFDVSVTVG